MGVGIRGTLVAALVLLAGCTTGLSGLQETPTETATQTAVETPTATPENPWKGWS